MKSDVKSLLDDLEKQREAGKLTDDDLKEFNKTGGLSLTSSYTNPHYDELNKTGKEYESNVKNTANQLSNIVFDEADKKTNIEKAASKVKTARSDETRDELLDVTGDFKGKQDKRYSEVENIVKRQENIANRQANMGAAKAGKYGDIYSDGAMANIKNNIVKKYGENILNAEQYALNTNRTIDNDLLNVGLKEIADKDKRDAFKNILLDKENSYMLSAISEAADGNKEAIKDVNNFYKTYLKTKASNESKRAGFTELRYGMEDEFKSADTFMKGNILRDLSSKVPGYSLVADRIPALLNKYPNLSLSELQGKVAKIAELALTAKQQLPTIGSKSANDRTSEETSLYNNYLDRGLEEQQRSDRHTSETIAQQEATSKGEIKQGGTIYDNTPKGQEVLNKKRSTRTPTPVRKPTPTPIKRSIPITPKVSVPTISRDTLKRIGDALRKAKGTSRYNSLLSSAKSIRDKIRSGKLKLK